ncbi:MAG: 4Fe-4S binding protein [candidate division WOR-3 bacterium]|nr:MAG: 4Fe-4S binding protein [candidate division WOR-3 bacterium]
MLDECHECTLCQRACPTGAIPDDRFLLRAERCIAFHNEHERDFPDWLRPEWHNALVGCMLCQKVCPVNKPVVDWIEDTCEFSEKETTQIIDQVSTERFSAGTLEKLKNKHFEVSISTLGRNLKALMIEKGIVNDRPSSDSQ